MMNCISSACQILSVQNGDNCTLCYTLLLAALVCAAVLAGVLNINDEFAVCQTI